MSEKYVSKHVWSLEATPPFYPLVLHLTPDTPLIPHRLTTGSPLHRHPPTTTPQNRASEFLSFRPSLTPCFVEADLPHRQQLVYCSVPCAGVGWGEV